MVSRRNYVAITIVMLVMLFMFQFSGVAADAWNDYEENPYAKDRGALPAKGDAYQPGQDGEDRQLLVCLGDGDSALANMAQTWATYMKWDVQTHSSFKQYEKAAEKDNALLPEMIVIDPESIDWENDDEIESLEGYVKSGIDLVFCGLPDAKSIEGSERTRSLLGIEKVVREKTTVAGLHLYEGFLLGGEALYKAEDQASAREKQDMDLTFPWYQLSSATKIYMRGIAKSKKVKDEDYPPVIWETSFASGYAFAINGDYMEDATGLGILSAIRARTSDYEIHPVVNAQNMVIANYPVLANENEEEMMRRYSQSMEDVLRNIAWPDIVEIYQRNSEKLGFTCMLAPQLDYGDEEQPSEDSLTYYMKLLNEQDAETGLSGCSVSDTPIEEKLAQDDAFMEAGLPDYRFSSFYGGDLTEKELRNSLKADILADVRTVVKGYAGESEILGYVSKDATEQVAVADGLTYTYQEDFRTRSIQTALGYSSVLVDAASIAYPADRGYDTWEDYTEKLSGNLQSGWTNYKAFSATTVSESDDRIRNFLALDYKETKKSNEISLSLDAEETPAWFLLRTAKYTVDAVQGGDWQEIESGAYLIKATDEDVSIVLKSAEGYSGASR